jgi:alanine dehydrogenase
MLIGVPKEIKNHEYRVGLTPASVMELVSYGHQVLVERSAGDGIGESDEAYLRAGARSVETASEIFEQAEMIIKVKEPQASERKMLRPGQVLFTYLHLAPDLEQTKDLIQSGSICIAYETVTDQMGRLPLLAPMSQVAGRLSIQAGANALERAKGGSGILLGGVPGVAPANVVVLGGGVVGEHAITMAIGLGANVTVLDKNLEVLSRLSQHFGPALKTLYSTKASISEQLATADLVIGAVLVAGAAAPKLVTRNHLKQMKKGSVLVDVAIDQGGCFETSHATTHTSPTYSVEDIVHYCVANMPGAVPKTSTYALNNATLPYIIGLANQGYKKALLSSPHFMNGLNVIEGKVTCHAVCDALGYEYYSSETLLQ